ncbi:MAG: DUF1318 domain-containing protein [Geobacter sp.]|nr:DUF1318 domain-containing protein [Geobacter sp.]
MKTRILKLLLSCGCALLASCAIITVNVYFPEKAVKDAYKSVDEMLLKGSADKPGADVPPPATEQTPPETKPQSRLLDRLPRLALVGEAQAAENYADDLAVELASMPEVDKAYDEMSKILPKITALLESGAIGLTNQGLVTVRDKTKMTPQDETLIKAENESRKTVVNGMAKAILKLNKQKESAEALNQIRGKAAATYAEIKREAAKPGWWTQLPNGRWVQK